MRNVVMNANVQLFSSGGEAIFPEHDSGLYQLGAQVQSLLPST